MFHVEHFEDLPFYSPSCMFGATLLILFLMDVITAIKERRSIRSFRADRIEGDKIELLKQALVWAPSAGNLQKRHFYFVFNNDVKKKLASAAFSQSFIAQAPLVVVACADMTIGDYYRERGIYLYCIQDASCSVENMMLLAHSIGLGSVWVGAFDEDEVSKVLELPETLRPMAIVPVGYPQRVPRPPKRVEKNLAVTEII